MSASASSCAPSRKRATIIKRFMVASFVSSSAKFDLPEARRHPGRPGGQLRVCRRFALEDDKNAEVLVGRETMIRPGLDEDSRALSHGDLLALYLEDACPFEDDVELVVVVRLLAVRLGRDEAVDTDFEAGGLVDDLVTTAGLTEPLLDGCDFECVHWANL